jgi:hypothetical protein
VDGEKEVKIFGQKIVVKAIHSAITSTHLETAEDEGSHRPLISDIQVKEIKFYGIRKIRS